MPLLVVVLNNVCGICLAVCVSPYKTETHVFSGITSVTYVLFFGRIDAYSSCSIASATYMYVFISPVKQMPILSPLEQRSL
jgi:hypothetical protein